ncbi:hypothetical protein MMC2321_00096 [Chitinophaga sp. MM2321]
MLPGGQAFRGMLDHINHNENALLTGFANKETTAFTTIYNRYYIGLLSFARRFVVLEIAEDIIAESFVKLWQTPHTFESLAQIHQWLRITVRNTCLNHLRQQKSMTRKQQEMFALNELEYEDQYFRDKVYADLHHRIIAEIGKMPPQQQHILKMFFLEEMNNAAIADHLKISVQAVKNQKVTALKALRRLFSKDELIICMGMLSTFFPWFSK